MSRFEVTYVLKLYNVYAYQNANSKPKFHKYVYFISIKNKNQSNIEICLRKQKSGFASIPEQLSVSPEHSKFSLQSMAKSTKKL